MTARPPRAPRRAVVLLAAAVTTLVVAGTVVTVQAGDPTDARAVSPSTRTGAVDEPVNSAAGPSHARVVTAPAQGPPPTAAPVMTPVPPPPPALAPAQEASDDTTGRQQGRSAQAPAAPRAGAACDVGAAAGSSQVVVVRSSGSTATVRACSRTSDGSYVTDLGPYRGFVGRSGVTPAGSKREGDGATPGGVFALRGGFGTRADPGLAQGWFTVDGADVWVDDPASSLYNTHQRAPSQGRWASAEQLADPPAYTYAQVIGYNESARPGAGSAIFLHVSTGNPTLGCVSLPSSALLEVMRWERPGAVIAIS